MLDELNVLRGLRPDIEGPSLATLDQARSALSAEIAGETGRRGNGWRHSRWLVPCFIVAMLGAGGLAAAGLSDWWTDADPPVRRAEAEAVLTPPDDLRLPPSIVADVDRLRTVARAPGAALLAAPAKDSQKNYCLVRVPDGGDPEFNCFGFGPGIENEVLMSWVHEFDDATAWYLFGRVTDPGAARITLFEDMTYPLDVEGMRRAPEQPLTTEIGPGGFFLARLPEAMWPSLELGYGSVSILDSTQATVRRGCIFLGLPPPSPHAGLLGGPHRYDVGASQFEQPCPATGSSVTAATMKLTRAEDEWSGFTGVELASRERIALESYSGTPVVAAVWDGGYVPTSHRLLDALDTFARRHPEARVVVVADKRHAQAQGIGSLQAAKSRTPSIPILLGEIDWPMMAGKGTFLVALAPDGSAKAELVPSRDEQLNTFPLVSQDLLDELLAATG
jgi:hypothetical protein